MDRVEWISGKVRRLDGLRAWIGEKSVYVRPVDRWKIDVGAQQNILVREGVARIIVTVLRHFED